MKGRLLLAIAAIFLVSFCKSKNTKIENNNFNHQMDKNSESKKDTAKVNTEFLKEIITAQQKLGIEALKTNYTIFVSFDGSCSSCVVEFLDQLPKIREVKAQNQIKYLFIAFAKDAYLIEYYIAEAGLELKSNEFLIIDTKHAFEKDNTFIEKYAMNILLTNQKYEVIALGDPYRLKEVYNIYAKNSLL